MNDHSLEIRRTGSTYRLLQEQILPISLNETFEFFSDPKNLEELTPGRLSFEVKETSPLPVEEGTTIRYLLKIWVFPAEWISEITNWNPPHEFSDIMRKGPYKRWEHRHGFEEIDGGKTRISDDVTYELPLGLLGLIGGGMFVRWDVTSIFRYRARQLEERFGQPA